MLNGDIIDVNLKGAQNVPDIRTRIVEACGVTPLQVQLLTGSDAVPDEAELN